MPKVKKNKKKKIIPQKTLSPKRTTTKHIGEIVHYFSNIKVAVVSLKAPLKNGETIRIIGGEETDFKQKVSSMQIDKKTIMSAKKGDSIGIKISQKVREGYKVFKI